MGWDDRNYNAGREEMNAYFANPGALLQYTLPLYVSATLHIRLSFWFLLSAIFLCVQDVQGSGAGYILLDLAVMLGVCLWHEFGHRVFSRMVGGNHWEWILWPIGGMVAPSVPRTPKATFVGNVGGIVFSVVLLAASLTTTYFLFGESTQLQYLWGIPSGFTGYVGALGLRVLFHGLGTIAVLSMPIIMMNLFPCYWFDGAYIWQSILWPFIGQWKAMRWVCMAGMILAVPLLVMSLMAHNFFGLVVWALVFSDCFRRRQALAAAGPDVFDDDVSYSYMDAPESPRRKKLKKRWFRNARKRAQRDQAEQAKIDAILAKVSERGIQSLGWWEKRTLRKATERQRKQDMAGRL
jgi:hypothetical protein